MSRALYKGEKMNGDFVSYHENGKEDVKCNYTEGKLNGELKRYDEYGRLKYIYILPYFWIFDLTYLYKNAKLFLNKIF